MQSPPQIQVKLVSLLPEEKSPEYQDLLNRASCNPEAILLFEEFRNQALQSLANLEYDPRSPNIYHQWVYYHKAQLAIYSELIQKFKKGD